MSEKSLLEALAEGLQHGKADLPVLPTVMTEVLRVVQNPASKTDHVVAVIEADPPLAARVLSVAGSAFYSRGRPPSSVRQAVVRLGTQALRDVAYMAVYANTVFDVPGLATLVRESFERSVMLARACRAVCAEGRVDEDTAFLAGLLHDMGRARLYKLIAKTPFRDANRDVIEAAVDALHERAGAELARSWKLPTAVAAACSEHHHPPFAEPASMLVYACDRAAVVIAGGESNPVTVTEDLLVLGVPLDLAVAASHAIRSEIEGKEVALAG